MPTEEDRTSWTQESGIPGRAAYLWIYDEWIASSPRQGARVVEVGVALGKSLAYLCARLMAEGRDDVEVWAVDPWAGTHQNGEQQSLAGDAGGDFSLYARSMLARAPKAFERVRVLRAPSPRIASFFPLGTLDLVVLDGDHIFPVVDLEITVWAPRLYVTGWIGGDDHCADFPGVEQACRKHFGEPGRDYEVRTEQGWGTWLKRDL